MICTYAKFVLNKRSLSSKCINHWTVKKRTKNPSQLSPKESKLEEVRVRQIGKLILTKSFLEMFYRQFQNPAAMFAEQRAKSYGKLKYYLFFITYIQPDNT